MAWSKKNILGLDSATSSRVLSARSLFQRLDKRDLGGTEVVKDGINFSFCFMNISVEFADLLVDI